LSEEHKLQVGNKSAEEILSSKRLGKRANYDIKCRGASWNSRLVLLGYRDEG